MLRLNYCEYSCLLILAAFISLPTVNTWAADVIIMKKNAVEGVSHFETKKFKTEAERDDYIKSLDPDIYEWEIPQSYKTDELTVQEKAKQQMQSDPLLGDQWSIFPDTLDPLHFSGADIDAIRAWEIVDDSPNVVVYVLDSGIDDRDPDLSGRIVGSFNALKPGSPAFDENGHGTHVGSIIGAAGSDNYGIKGIVPGSVQIVGVKFLSATSEGDTNSALAALDWIYQDMKQRRQKNSSTKFILSNSWGGGYSRFLLAKMKALSDFDYLPITSAGNQATDNDREPYYPCNYEVTANTCVGATDYFDRRATFSGYGAKSVHLFAPGVQILGVVPGTVVGGNYVSRRSKKNGTSQAVPHVSGVAALIWEANPKLSATEVQEILVNSVDQLPGGEAESVSGGRLNAYRAVLMATGQDPSLANRSISQTEKSSIEDGGGCSIQPKSEAEPGVWMIMLGFAIALACLKRRRSQSFNQ